MEAVAFAVSIPLAFWLGEPPFQISVLRAVVLLVVIVEVLEAAVVALVDRIDPERHGFSRIAKDLGSLSVLLASILDGMVSLAVSPGRFAK
ncbi:MAG: diacylglycerol kinase [Pseudomonadota bacterium]